MNAQDLIVKINNKKRNCNKGSDFTIKGVGNLSTADLNTLELYAQTYQRDGNIYSLVKPYGRIKRVLGKYSIF